MKISHKLCVKMDGTQFLILWWFTAKNERENDKIAWVYHGLIYYLDRYSGYFYSQSILRMLPTYT